MSVNITAASCLVAFAIYRVSGRKVRSQGCEYKIKAKDEAKAKAEAEAEAEVKD